MPRIELSDLNLAELEKQLPIIQSEMGHLSERQYKVTSAAIWQNIVLAAALFTRQVTLQPWQRWTVAVAAVLFTVLVLAYVYFKWRKFYTNHVRYSRIQATRQTPREQRLDDGLAPTPTADPVAGLPPGPGSRSASYWRGTGFFAAALTLSGVVAVVSALAE